MSKSAIYEFLGRALETNHQIKMPTKISKTRTKNDQQFFVLQGLCCGVVYPVTRETITKYKKLMEYPIKTQVWTRSMSKKLGRLSQGFGEEK